MYCLRIESGAAPHAESVWVGQVEVGRQGDEQVGLVSLPVEFEQTATLSQRASAIS